MLIKFLIFIRHQLKKFHIKQAKKTYVIQKYKTL